MKGKYSFTVVNYRRSVSAGKQNISAARDNFTYDKTDSMAVG